jgi:hypothetical protein
MLQLLTRPQRFRGWLVFQVDELRLRATATCRSRFRFVITIHWWRRWIEHRFEQL